jgi:nucleotide-binding universal stress UspA family protein
MQTIIVATDGSPGANRAVDAAAKLAKTGAYRLLILTVGGNITGEKLRRLASIEGDVSEVLEAASDQILELARKRALRNGITAIKLQSGWGDPAEIILNIAKREKAYMLVVGRRGRGRLSGLLLGSVSQKLASLAACIVVVVP